MKNEEIIQVLEIHLDSLKTNRRKCVERRTYTELTEAVLTTLNHEIQACSEAVEIIKRAPDDEPLTLEQLREMNGHPVWIAEAPYWGHWELSEDAEDYILDRDPDLYGLTYPDPDGKGGLHKLGWLAYAYPPARIDRETWEPCELCEKQRKVFNEKFCGECGRPLTEEAWAELEKRISRKEEQ